VSPPAATREPVLIRGQHVSTLHQLSAELAELHREMLRTGHDEVRPVRTAVLTLVAVCVDDASADVAAEVVRRLASNHPARAILVVADRNAGPDGVDADLALECSAVGGAEQICAESVRLTVRGQPALHLASVITPLLLPDVPVALWLVGAPPLEQALHGEVLSVCERILLDSDAYADPQATMRALVAAHREHGHLPVGDLAWERLLPWRELLAQGFDGGDTAPFLGGVQRVEVESCGSRPSAEAWLVAGWLGSRLDWPQHGGPEVRLDTRSDAHVEEGNLLAVHLHCAVGERTAEVSVHAGGGTTVTRIATGEGLAASGTAAAHKPDLHALVGRLLQESGEDRVYTAALRRAAQLAGGDHAENPT
jgi:glucose-6-phosphate dehydrogenase assembly protein OpcA